MSNSDQLSVKFSVIFALLLIRQSLFADMSTVPEVNYSGKFIWEKNNNRSIVSQVNDYEIKSSQRNRLDDAVTITVYKKGTRLYQVEDVLGVPQISNSGFLAVQKNTARDGAFSLRILDNLGKKVAEKIYYTAVELLGFNSKGDRYGIGSSDKLEIINCITGRISQLARGYQYNVSDNGEIIVIASRDKKKSILSIFKNERLKNIIAVGNLTVREIALSPDNGKLLIIDRDNLKLIDLKTYELKTVVSLERSGGLSFVDLLVTEDKIVTGIQSKNRDHTSFQGILREYSFDGKLLYEKMGAGRSRTKDPIRMNLRDNEFPWPFSPQDKAHTVWNGYLAITGSSNSKNGAYLHQGLDLDVPANEPTLSVSNGVCKARLYIADPSYLYWRVCVADVNTIERSDGWMYAHLIENTITVSPDDTVLTGQILGEIVKWNALSTGGEERGHIHFSRINDHGAQWSYTDDQWQNVCDPQTLLRPYGDTIPPQFLKTSNGTPFKFSENEGEAWLDYMAPHDLQGEVDVIVYMNDKVGHSKWLQPAFAIYYWLKRDSDGKEILPKTTGLIRNRLMPNYTGSLYNSTLPPVMHRMDNECSMYSSWTTAERKYYHIVTNNDGDSIIEAEDMKEALDTRNFADGDYWLFVELVDAAGNSAVDSIQVTFNNGITKTDDKLNKNSLHKGIEIINNNSSSRDPRLKFIALKGEKYKLKIYSLNGKNLYTKIGILQTNGTNEINLSHLKKSDGLYLFDLSVGKKRHREKLRL